MRVGAETTTIIYQSTERQPRIIAADGEKNVNNLQSSESKRRKTSHLATLPQIIVQAAETTTTEPDTTENPLFSGQYLEVNPGQYHEVNPGQYHETNPGQYTEVNPGQYKELHPGQYNHHQQQGLKVDDVTVDSFNRDSTKIYNVQAKAGDFIIGEIGKINVNSGQTLEGVRYTAVDGILDKGQISDILNRYFGASTS